jgi:sugar lactone lactonase YvrE
VDFRIIASGYCFLEAPRVIGEDVWFTELLLGGLHRLSPDGRIEVYLPQRKHIGGICLNEDGRLICGGPGGLIWFDPQSGASGRLLDRIGGEPLAGANDFFPDGRGGLYFGTGTGGDYEGTPKPCEIWRVDASGSATRQDYGLRIANGIGLSPDGKRLFHNESLVGSFVYDVQADGSLANKRLFVDREDGDGLAVDVEGGVWIACYDSAEIARYRPDGRLDRSEALPHRNVSSLCFGGPDGRDLYVTTGGDTGIECLLKGELPPKQAALFHARSDIAGLPVPLTRFRLPSR